MNLEAITASVTDKQIAGALFDFMGRLTTLDDPITLGCAHECSTVLNVAEKWAEERGLDLSGADVENWNDKRIARELVEVAKVLDGAYVSPDAYAAPGEIQRQFSRIRSIPNIDQRAQFTNMISEVAVRNRDRFGLTNRPEFRGWGAGDFMRLTKLITTAA